MLKYLILSSLLIVMGSMASARTTRYVVSDQPTLRCRVDLPGRPMTFVKYYRDTHEAWVESGYPRQTVHYTDVVEMTGLPPYGNRGTSLVAFGGDVPIIHYKLTMAGKIWYELHDATYPYSATWGALPGAKAKSEGVCWSPELPEIRNYDYGN